MKKALLLSSVIAMVATAANADYRTVYTNNCDPQAMHALLEREANAHRAVITEVICTAARTTAEPVMVSEPVYEPVYFEPSYEYIPVVDCVPGPIACPCSTCAC
ncbi:MAG: hypothetical protein J5620_02735 [Alphaproteobacteria bacterium]|nr:hypothetical protein [Alphaproteobacteria bacterium]